MNLKSGMLIVSLEIIVAIGSLEMPGRWRQFDSCNMFRVPLEKEYNTNARCFFSGRSWVNHGGSSHILVHHADDYRQAKEL